MVEIKDNIIWNGEEIEKTSSFNLIKQYWYSVLNIVNTFNFNPEVASELTKKLQEVRQCIWKK